MADGFLSRWSQRKQDTRQGRAVVDEPIQPAKPVASETAPLQEANNSDQRGVHKASPGTEAAQAQQATPEAKLPTLEDVGQLTPESDFSSFVAQGVSPEVRNAAVKKLFADPRYSLIDGLDIYLEDYSLPSPLSAAMLAKMHSAKVLKLIDDPDEDKALPDPQSGRALAQDKASTAPTSTAPASPETADAPATQNATAPIQDPGLTRPAQQSAQPTGETHDDPDLRLQPNHAAVGNDTQRGT